MTEKPENNKDETTIDISGNVQGQIVNIGSGSMTFHEKVTVSMTHSKQHIGNSTAGNDDEKAALLTLIEKLEAEISSVEEAHRDDAQDVAEKVEKLMAEVDKEEGEIEPDIVEVRTNHLKAAAENVKEVIPVVTEIALGIVARVVQMGIFQG